jgi:hypothetical protein
MNDCTRPIVEFDWWLSNRHTAIIREWKIRPSEELLPAERDRKWKRECRRGADDVPRQSERQVKIFAFLFSSNGDSVACSRSQAGAARDEKGAFKWNQLAAQKHSLILDRSSQLRKAQRQMKCLCPLNKPDYALTFPICKKWFRNQLL